MFGDKNTLHMLGISLHEEMKNDVSLVKIFSNIFKSPAQLGILVILLALSYMQALLLKALIIGVMVLYLSSFHLWSVY